MFDVFISHSSKDKELFVQPLVEELKKMNLEIWYDADNISHGEKLKESIKTGIRSSVVFLQIISKNYLQSRWASLELGILENSPDSAIILPIIYSDAKEEIASLYPFILQHKFILKENDSQNLPEIIYNMVINTKMELGYHNIPKTNLRKIAKFLRSYNQFKLDQISIKLSHIMRNLELDPILALNSIKLILEIVLTDVADHEGIYIGDNETIFDKFVNSSFLNMNIEEHFNFLFKLYRKSLRNFGSHESYNDTIGKDEQYLIEYSLFSIIEWYVISYFKKPVLEDKKIIVVSPDEITDSDIDDIHEIENFSLPPELIASPEMTRIWYEYNSLTIVGARDAETNKMVGFIHTLPITDEYYQNILSGNFDDTVIDLHYLRQYDIPGFYKLYLSSFCIHPKYNSSTAFIKIYSSFIEFLLTMAIERNIFISHIIADGATLKGSSICEHIGMEKCTTSVHGTTIYKGILIPPSMTTLKLDNKYGHQLIAYYKRIYEEYKELF